MKRIMCARCKQGIDRDKINKITPNTLVCNSCYDELLKEDIRMIRIPKDKMSDNDKVLFGLMLEEYFQKDEVTTHELKIYKEYYEPVLNGSKTFEIRKNDRNYRVGDRIVLNELQDDKKTCTGRYFKGVITYVTDYAQQDEYVVFGFRKEDWED
nr:DUF3850 domain-containing protein [Clostridioides sp.]